MRSASELRPLCNVLRVKHGSTGKQATGVTYIDARGNEVEQPASIVILGRAHRLQQHAAAAVVGIGTLDDPRTGTGVVGRNDSDQQGSRCTCSRRSRASIRSSAAASSTRRSTKSTAT